MSSSATLQCPPGGHQQNGIRIGNTLFNTDTEQKAESGSGVEIWDGDRWRSETTGVIDAWSNGSETLPNGSKMLPQGSQNATPTTIENNSYTKKSKAPLPAFGARALFRPRQIAHLAIPMPAPRHPDACVRSSR